MGSAYQVALVLTQPDRPAGRGMQPTPSPVKLRALENGIEVFQPLSLRSPDIAARLSAVEADALIVAAYGLILPPAVLGVARHGAINIHASLLPRWRGAAPIQRALLAGDRETGVSIMQMDQGLDTGPVFLQRRIPIQATDDFGTLHDQLAELGADALLEVLAAVASGQAKAQPQAEDGITYARKIEKSDTSVQWQQSAEQIERAVRAFRPAPGASACLSGEAIKIWRAHMVEGTGQPGALLDFSQVLRVACGAGALVIDEVQPAGGRRMGTRDFLRGHPLKPSDRFE